MCMNKICHYKIYYQNGIFKNTVIMFLKRESLETKITQ